MDYGTVARNVKASNRFDALSFIPPAKQTRYLTRVLGEAIVTRMGGDAKRPLRLHRDQSVTERSERPTLELTITSRSYTSLSLRESDLAASLARVKLTISVNWPFGRRSRHMFGH
jgi:hypothetical protein